MRRLTAIENVTLDGVMHAPGRPDEDTRDGFAHGGWATPFADRVLAEAMGRRMATASELLFGRRTPTTTSPPTGRNGPTTRSPPCSTHAPNTS